MKYLSILLILLFTISAQAAFFTVTRFDGRNATCTTDFDCSLREAVKAANLPPTNDVIGFAANVTFVSLTSEIVITDNGNLIITGRGANVFEIIGNNSSRIFYINSAVVLISGVTFRSDGGGSAALNGYGGGILTSNGSLTLDSVSVINNAAPINGGGILFNGGTHRIINSTIAGNTAIGCGGFFNNGGAITVVNSTISGNTVTEIGGGFCNQGNTTTLRNVTISNNNGREGGGIYQTGGGGSINLGNTIVASNNSTGGIYPDFVGDTTTTSVGYNFIGNNASVEATFPAGNPNANQDRVGTSNSPLNPLLGALRNNGGTTSTQALLFGSLAIDKGSNLLAVGLFGNQPLTTDQRGSIRIADGDGNGTATVDIGAYEYLRPTATNVTISGRATTQDGRGIASVSISINDSNGNVRAMKTDANGYYGFSDVEVGSTYIITATGKRFTFTQSSRVVNVSDDTQEINFVGTSEKRLRAF